MSNSWAPLVTVGGQTGLRFNVHANRNPNVNDDIGSGAGVNCPWLNITGNSIWCCIDPMLGAAAWARMALFSDITAGTVTNVATDSTLTGGPITTTGALGINPAWAGQTAIVTVGTVVTGTWNATIIGTAYGGTGVDNSTGGTANTFWARPNGSTGAATYRAIVAADVPTLNQNTTGSAVSLASGATQASSTIGGNLLAATVALSATNYFGFGCTTTTTTETNARTVVPYAAIVRNLYLRTSSAQPATGALTFTVLKNGSATTVTFTVAAGAAAALFSDTSNSFTVAAGDEISIQVANAGLAISAAIQGWSLEIDRTS